MVIDILLKEHILYIALHWRKKGKPGRRGKSLAWTAKESLLRTVGPSPATVIGLRQTAAN